jgi:hypothetical protein
MNAYGGVVVELHAFLTSVLGGGEWSASGTHINMVFCRLIKLKCQATDAGNMKFYIILVWETCCKVSNWKSLEIEG